MAQNNVATAELPVTRRLPRGGMLICILGSEGSGTTALALALAEALRAEDINATYAWTGSEPSPRWHTRLLGRALLGREGMEGWDPRRFTPRSGRFRSRCWKQFALMDLAECSWRRVWAPMAAGKTVVVDRWVYDTMVALCRCFRWSPEELLRSPFLRLFPRPNLTVYVRSSSTASAPETRSGPSGATLALEHGLYGTLRDRMGMDEVSADRSPAELHAAIRRLVWKRLGF